MESNGKSPIPNRSVPTTDSPQLNFPDAMREVLNGHQITRLSWTDASYCKLKDTLLQIFIRGEWHTWTINDGDMSGIDWITLPHETETPVETKPDELNN